MIEEFLFLFTGIVGLIATIIMATSHKFNPFFNIFLMLIFVMTSFRFLIHGSYELGLQLLIKPDKGSNSIFYLAIVPNFYLYYKNLVNREKSFHIKDLKHYLFIILLYFINTVPDIKNSILFYTDPIIYFIIIALYVGFYFWKIYFLLRNKLWNKKNISISYTHYNLIKNWTLYLFAFNTITAITLLISIYIEATTGAIISGKSKVVVLLLFWAFFYFKVLISPEILYGLPVLNKKLLLFNKRIVGLSDNWELSHPTPNRNQDLRLQENIKSNILSYVNEVDHLSYTATIFRDSTYSLTDIANQMKVPTSHIVYLFKYHSKIPFSEYRMHSRIQDAITLIHCDYLKLNTFEALAYKTGFSSYNPFFIAFKKITKSSPQEYIKNQKNLQI